MTTAPLAAIRVIAVRPDRAEERATAELLLAGPLVHPQGVAPLPGLAARHADPANGSGLHGLADRVHALDGHLDVRSPAGRGTRIDARIPCASTPTQARPG